MIVVTCFFVSSMQVPVARAQSGGTPLSMCFIQSGKGKSDRSLRAKATALLDISAHMATDPFAVFKHAALHNRAGGYAELIEKAQQGMVDLEEMQASLKLSVKSVEKMVTQYKKQNTQYNMSINQLKKNKQERRARAGYC